MKTATSYCHVGTTPSIPKKNRGIVMTPTGVVLSTILLLIQLQLMQQLQLTNAFTLQVPFLHRNNHHHHQSHQSRQIGSNIYKSFIDQNRHCNKFASNLHSSSKTDSSSSSTSEADETKLLDEIKQMRVRAIKEQLDGAGISTADCFEKEELVQRLYDHKMKTKKNGKKATTSESSRKTSSSSSSSSTPTSTSSTIRVPMDFHSLSTQSVKSHRGDTYLRPSPGKFPSITVTLPTKGNQKINLLVDTACSGLILRPHVARNKLQLPTINMGVTMTAAGGTVGTDNSVCSLDCIELMDDNKTQIKDLVVVAQDIGALPPVLDGIIGLSFLERFHSISFDFNRGELLLHSKKNAITEYDNPMAYEVLAETNLSRSRLGIYIAPTTLDGRGPVKMIVDTGSAGTFLNWKGVGDMSMDRSHPLVSYNTESIGVMGADNNALALSHRFVVKRRVNFDSSSGNVGMFAAGLDLMDPSCQNAEINVDIGDLPVLETMKYEGVGGILGSDILMNCDVVHVTNLIDRGTTPKLTLLKCKDESDSYY